MKLYKSFCLLTSFLVIFSGSFSQNPENIPVNDTAVYPYWIYMMQDPGVNFFTVQRTFDLYWQNRPVERSSGWKVFKRWEYMMQSRVTSEGIRPAADAVVRAYESVITDNRSVSGNWVSLGPSLIPSPGPAGYEGLGRLNVIAFHPSDPNTLFVGAPSGGLWQTTDGGLTWVTHTDTLPTLGVSAIVVDYTNPQIILLGSGDRDASDAPGLGVYKSTNGGLTWAPSKTGMGDVTVGKILQHPANSSIFLAATSGGVYRTTNGGSTWTQTSTGNYKDICFKPGDPDVIYASKSGNFFRSSNNGVSFTQITSGLTTGQRGAIAVTATNPNYVYFVQSNTSSGYKGLYRSTDAGLNFTTRSTSPNILDWSCNGGASGGQGWYDLAIAADPLNAEIIYVGGVNVWKSTNGGTSWSINSHWYGGCGVPAVHADCHYLTYSPVNGTLYACNDGGLYFTINGGTTWTDRTETMTIGQIYKLGQSQTVKELVINGFQDNGTYTYTAAGWLQSGGGDGMECAVDYSNAAYTYYTIYYGDIYRLFNNGNELHIAGNGVFGINESGAWVTPFVLGESDPKMMFAGFKNIWRCNDVRTTNNLTWTKISDNLGGSNSSNMAVVEQSKANTSILYATRYDSKLFRTDNCLASNPAWTDLTSSLPVSGTPTDIEAHPTDQNIVYMTLANGVYKSTNNGQTWTNITGNLPNIHISTIAYYSNAPEGLYVGTDAGVFYKDQNTVNWILFNSGLPVSAEITELDIYYDNDSVSADVIRASSYGRGLWGSDMYSSYSPDFTADSTTICLNLNVDFTDLSNGSPTAWNWYFPGGTPSGSTLQNPQNIVYAVPGSYDVTLTTTWGSYSIPVTKTGFITVNGPPAAPGMPQGDSLLCENNSNTQYTIFSVPGATSYTWQLSPASAGVLTPSDTTVLVDWEDTWSGYALLSVQANGNCGSSSFSPARQIHLQPFPVTPVTPSGPDQVCQGTGSSTYSILQAANATSYQWDIIPASAGTISGADTIGTVGWDPTYTGAVFIRVRSINNCNESAWSDSLDVGVYEYPVVFLGNDTSILNTDTLILDAGIPGMTYLWSTGEITQTIYAYYTGAGSTVFWVDVTNIICSAGDTITVTFTDPVSVMNQIRGATISVIPNPNRGTFRVEISSETNAEITLRVLDVFGRMLVRKEVSIESGINTIGFSLTGLNEGIYFLEVKNESVRRVMKFFIIQ
jgi:photosystem II stability/assembly factor-like uncharacterized protein